MPSMRARRSCAPPATVLQRSACGPRKSRWPTRAALAGRGLHVVVLLDSLARLAGALREVAVAAGEPAGRGGYPPGVFAELARFVEIAGNFDCGSMTLVASVLDDGDERDPVSDAARSLLDGHIALSPSLAAHGHFPAIDVLRSASRTMDAVADAHTASRGYGSKCAGTAGTHRRCASARHRVVRFGVRAVR